MQVAAYVKTTQFQLVSKNRNWLFKALVPRVNKAILDHKNDRLAVKCLDSYCKGESKAIKMTLT